MQSVRNYKQIFVVLAIVAVFSTVATERVCADDAHLITNVVYTSENTGGIHQRGQDGEDGQSGQDGEDGKPGTDGAPGTSGSIVTKTI